MNIFALTISLLLFIQLSECTLSPPKGKTNKKSKGKVESKVEKMELRNSYGRNIYSLCINLIVRQHFRKGLQIRMFLSDIW